MCVFVSAIAKMCRKGECCGTHLFIIVMYAFFWRDKPHVRDHTTKHENIHLFLFQLFATCYRKQTKKLNLKIPLSFRFSGGTYFKLFSEATDLKTSSNGILFFFIILSPINHIIPYFRSIIVKQFYSINIVQINYN